MLSDFWTNSRSNFRPTVGDGQSNEVRASFGDAFSVRECYSRFGALAILSPKNVCGRRKEREQRAMQQLVTGFTSHLCLFSETEMQLSQTDNCGPKINIYLSRRPTLQPFNLFLNDVW